MLNRCGHVPSYHTIEEIENELTLNATSSTQLTPFGMQMEPGLCTGITIDNFNRYVETTTEKDTLHDTVGIAYQNIQCASPPASNVSTPNLSANNDFDFPSLRKKKKTPGRDQTDFTVETMETEKLPSGYKRRRKFESVDEDIEPYRKKPKMICTISSNDMEQLIIPESYALAVYKDLLWILSMYLNTKEPLMWTGWNSKGVSDNSRGDQQQIWYLPQINASPTSTTVVIEALRRTLQIAAESQLSYLSLTCDLAIAKLAYQIQATEAPDFDIIFINLGAFHIEMAYFNAIGKYIAESGGPYILTESGILASGSMNAFIKGKHYNRCKRIHMLFCSCITTFEIKRIR